MKLDHWTRSWIRNRGDEKAVADGCTFSIARASYFIWWCERHLKLYQGVSAEEPHVFHSIADQPKWLIPDTFDWNDPETRELYEARADWHNELRESGHFMDWQYECHMRMYGWTRWSEHWKRTVRRFRKAILFVAKKNKKSPAIAANGLYLTCGDSQMGNNVFIFAKDGGQAREIAGEHMVNMYEMSPELRTQCRLNKTKCRITHTKSRSFIQPASSGDTRTRQSKEGLNGDIIIDELHVVDEETDTIVKRAGISKPESWIIGFSTSGRENTGYGKKEFDFALDVENGLIEAQDVFAGVYAPPQDTTAEQILADPIKYAKMSNPALGHTVNPEELLSDLETSKLDPKKLDDCLVYRFNIWRQGGSPAFNSGLIDKCFEEFDWNDFLGYDCWAGLDMAKHDDLCSLALLFERDNLLYPLVHSWKPRKTAMMDIERVPYLEYERLGLITLVEESVIRPEFIFSEIERFKKMYRINEIHYDPYKMAFLSGRIEEKLKIEVLPFPQESKNFHPCIELAQTRVLNNKIRFRKLNDLLKWQLNHVQIREDKRNGYKAFAKPDSGDYKKIDSVVALTMAIRGYLIANPLEEETVDMYSTENLEKWKSRLTM